MSTKSKKSYAKKAKKTRPSGGSSGKKISKDVVKIELKDGRVILSQVVDELPKNPIKGRFYSITRDNKKIGRRQRLTAEATGKVGFGKWKFRSNETIKRIPKSQVPKKKAPTKKPAKKSVPKKKSTKKEK